MKLHRKTKTRIPDWILCLMLLGSNGAVMAEPIYGLTINQRLITFDSASPAEIFAEVALQGLGGEQLVAIDGRPATSELFGVTVTQKIYKIDTESGEVAFVGQPLPDMPDLDFFVGFDFNPTVDRIRWVNGQAKNLRFHPETGGLVAVDGTLAYAVEDSYFGLDPEILGAAYLSDGTLFGIDTRRDILVKVSPPNDGVLNTVGRLGINAGVGIGFDASPMSGTLYGAFTNPIGNQAVLYQVNPTSGMATPLGSIGDGTQILSIAVALDLNTNEGTLYEVTTLADVVGLDGVLSLREALEAANSNTAVFEAPAGRPGDIAIDEIRFHEDLIGQTIGLEMGELVIRDSLRISGSDSERMVLDALQKNRVMTLEPSAHEVFLDHLTLTGGLTEELGGGLWVKEGLNVVLEQVEVHGNSATQGGGVFSSANSFKGMGLHVYSNQSPSMEIPDTNGFSSAGSGLVQTAGSLVLEDSLVMNDVVLKGVAELSGNPVIEGALVALDESTISPGMSPGTLQTSEALLSESTTYRLEILGKESGTEIDFWRVSGKLTLMNPRLDGTILDGLDFNQGEVVTLVDHTGNEPTRGMFAGQPEGSFMWIGLKTFQISYRGGDGNDVVLLPLGQLGRVNIALNEVPSFNAETGKIEQRITLFNNTSNTQSGIVLLVSDLPVGVGLENLAGEILLGTPPKPTPFVLLGQPLGSGENITLLFEYSGGDDVGDLSPTYSIRSRAEDGSEVSITLILKRLDGSVLLEFKSKPENSYRVRSSRNLKTWVDSDPIIAVSDLTPWLDFEPELGGTLKFYQIIQL